MTEKQYIIATNRVKVSLALQILRDVFPGDEYGITATELSHIRRSLSLIETRLFGATKIEEPEEN